MNTLILSFYYPPYGFGGARRMFLLKKYLEQKGHYVRIVTKGNINKYENNIFYIKDTINREKIKKKNNSIRKYNIFPDSMFLWSLNAVKYAKKHENEFDKIIITSPPPSIIMLSALFFNKKMKRKTIIDLRDTWADAILQEYANIFYKKIDLILEKFSYKQFDNFVTATKGIQKRLKERYDIDAKLIENAIEKKNINILQKNMKQPSLFYAGKLDKIRYNEMFFKVWNKICIENDFHLYYAGKNRSNSINNYHFLGFLDINEIFNYIFSSSAGLILLNPEIHGIDEAFPTKILDYILMKKKILYVGPSSCVSEFIENEKIGMSITDNKEESIIEGIKKIFENKYEIKDEIIEKLNYKNIYEKYLRLLSTAYLNNGGP